MNVADFLDPDRWLSEGSGPRYLQLRKRIAEGIEAGDLPPATPLPPEREIASLTDLSRVTVRKAIQTLAEEGLIVQRQGSGSFVATRERRFEQSLSRLTSFTEDMQRRGLTSSSKWLERGIFMPSPEEVLALALGPEDSVARISRLRIADGSPLAIERASLPLEFLPNPTEVDNSLYEILDASGLRPVRALQKISAIEVTEEEARLLETTPGSAGLHLARTSYLPDGSIVEFTQSLYRGDRYDFVAELRLGRA